MSLRKDGYKIRLMDEKIAKYLRIFSVVSIEGPKWCGKTWTALNHVNSATYMMEKSQKDLAQMLCTPDSEGVICEGGCIITCKGDISEIKRTYLL